MSVGSMSAYLEALTKERPEEFPGVNPDERENAAKYLTALTALYQACVPLYREAAQACLLKDIAEIHKSIRNSCSETKDELIDEINALLIEKLRYLNGHGPEHLQAVDAKAFELVQAVNLEISPYEVFFCAAALTIHDAGLIFGRDGHEHSI